MATVEGLEAIRTSLIELRAEGFDVDEQLASLEKEIVKARHAPCWIAGPYLPVGDVDWVCRTHGDVICLNDTDEPPRRAILRCPVADPRPGDPPAAYEKRGTR